MAATETEPRPRTEDDLARINLAQRVWNEATDPRGTLAETYLREHRKLTLPNDLCGTVLRFHPHCKYRDENTGAIVSAPALIAPFRSIDDDVITGIQRVLLNDDSTKLTRRMLGIVYRAAIKLDPAGETLHIGEGLETCLAGRQLGLSPAWALGSVGAISFFPIIAVKSLLIFGETGDASRRAVEICVKRWHKARRRVRIVMPEYGSDLNDTLILEKAQ